MIKYATIMLGLIFATPMLCSDFTQGFSTTKFCTGFFVGLTPLFVAQTLKKSVSHHSMHFYPIIAASSVVSALTFEVLGGWSRVMNNTDKQKKRLGESFIAGFLSAVSAEDPSVYGWLIFLDKQH